MMGDTLEAVLKMMTMAGLRTDNLTMRGHATWAWATFTLAGVEVRLNVIEGHDETPHYYVAVAGLGGTLSHIHHAGLLRDLSLLHVGIVDGWIVNTPQIAHTPARLSAT